LRTRLIVDSASDIPLSYANEHGLIYMPIKVQIDETDYLDNVTITPEEFYEKLAASKKLPVTSLLTPYEYEKVFNQVQQDGDEVVVITLSGKLSGTAHSAATASESFPERVFVVDSENATVGERILVEYAIRLRDQGMRAAELSKELEAVKHRICLIALIDTLEYLMKGGRISKTAAIAGGLLNIKPVLTVEDGVLVVLGKARGSRQSNNFLNDAIQKKGGIDFSMPYMLAYSGTDDALLRGYIENSRHIWAEQTNTLPVSMIGSTIGTHSGPGAIAAAFFCKES